MIWCNLSINTKNLEGNDLKDKLESYIESKKPSGEVFAQNFVENLYTLLYAKTPERWTKKRKKLFQEALKEDDLTENINSAVPELSTFFERVHSDEFTKSTYSYIQKTQKNILEIFQEKNSIRNNPEKFTEIVHIIRNSYKEKMKGLLLPEEYTYFFKYTNISIETIGDDKYFIQIHMPIGPEEKEKKEPYIVQKFDNEFLPFFEKILKDEIGAKKYWKYEYNLMPEKGYTNRKNDIGEKDYKKFYGYEKTGTDQQPQQGTLFPSEIKSPISTPFIQHSGNEEATKLLSHRYKNQSNIHAENIPGIVLRSNDGDPDKKVIVDHFLQFTKKETPFLKVQVIDCDMFAKKCIKLLNWDNKNEKFDDRNKRIDEMIEKMGKANLYILHDIEKLENKIYTQNIVLEKILQGAHKKFIITSNKNVTEFHTSQIVDRNENNDKPIFEKKGFLPEFLDKIHKAPKGKVSQPAEIECGEILYKTLTKKYPSIEFPQKIIKKIGEILPNAGRHHAIIEEIVVACESGEKKFTYEMAREIVKNHTEELYQPSLQDIAIIVKKYVADIQEEYNRNKIQMQKTASKYIAYMAKLTFGARNRIRTDEEIGNFLHITPTTVKAYIREISNAPGHIRDIEKKLQDSITEKEKGLLGYY